MSGVQFNLLPSVKLDYIKAQSTRSRVTAIASVVCGIAVFILIVIILFVEVVQKKQLNDASTQISTASKAIQSQTDITKILTVQNQLTTLSNLHSNKHITSRVFDDLVQITPAGVNLSRLSLDYTKNIITIDGTADSATSVNKFVDTLKFTNYTIGSDSTNHTAFTSVVESNFNISSTTVSYSLNVTFDPNLFANNIKDSTGAFVAPKLVVPNQTTTRSSLFSGGQ